MKTSDLVSVYETMLKIRLFEERVIELYPAQEMKTPVHLCIGQEAIAAGVCQHLLKDDLLFTTHRCHGHAIAKGMNFSSMMAEFYGKKTGCSGGKGGSMHLSDPEVGILSTSAIVGGTIALAVGAALSLKLKKSKNITVAFFGDGATDEGIFYESLNFAALKRLPVLFVCENNFYATNSPQKARQPLDNIFQRGKAFGIKGFRCDGNDANKVFGFSGRLVEKIRKEGRPYILECRTYRWKGHVGPDCDAEKGCRPRYEVNAWIKKCPIKKIEKYLLRNRFLSNDAIGEMRNDISKKIDQAVVFAKNSPAPDMADVLNDVYWSGRCPGQK